MSDAIHDQRATSLAALQEAQELAKASSSALSVLRWSASKVAACSLRRSRLLEDKDTGPSLLSGRSGRHQDPASADHYSAECQALQPLRRIQRQLSLLEPSIPGPMRWLIHVMVNSRHDSQQLLRGMLIALAPFDFSVFHFDARSPADETALRYSRQRWFAEARVVHRGFVRGTGCILEALQTTVGWMLGQRRGVYSHLWKLDSDLDLSLLDLAAFRALVAHRAPFLSQPAVVPVRRGRRGSDRTSLMAELARRDNDSRLTRPTARVAGRERVASQRLLPNGDTPDLIEIMCPLIDAALLPAWHAAITPMETRNDFAAEQALNGLANAFAQAAGRWPPPRPLQPSDDLRPAGAPPPTGASTARAAPGC
ncbi:hypothetical protein EMIHUDRAFT_421136 [Emiliania huxleyi CCMP1516]|uniref:Protein xylosyltransferase n=2 Tax=Emiliania huxleyi TaxID=2903 RepID=A0A0D3K2Q2_EMIH1|nr:hypothetical protein EMIHUDRAFT_421136 [Emiliania huxleyi CCMP1516]EOD30037.1 hypothetical protein EMIHUDRAFT_421136 [Emiliania huxleyi CCMP1516]|eukprot:XP_005782466.1 hypothetical protein EMIHUDRAFT_421136 [Emiliania huxleyi CCMP1516]